MKILVCGILGAMIALCQPSLDSGTPASNLAGVGNTTTLAIGGSGAITNHLLVVCMTANYTSVYSAGTMSSVLTSSGNWHLQSGPLATGGQDYLEMWYAISQGTGADTLTWSNVHSMGNVRMSVASFGGINTSSVVDQTATPGNQTTTSSFTSGSISVLLNSLLVGCSNKFNTAPSMTKGASYTQLINGGAISNSVLMQYQIASPAGSYASDWTTSASTSGISMLVGFKATGSGMSIHHGVKSQ